jgi:hypothetical protein
MRAFLHSWDFFAIANVFGLLVGFLAARAVIGIRRRREWRRAREVFEALPPDQKQYFSGPYTGMSAVKFRTWAPKQFVSVGEAAGGIPAPFDAIQCTNENGGLYWRDSLGRTYWEPPKNWDGNAGAGTLQRPHSTRLSPKDRI